MYCKCKSPKKKVSEANGNSFVVCAKSQGGCGEEINQSFTVSPAQLEVTKEMIDSIACGIELCPDCEGGGFSMVCYGGMPIEKNCEHCDGRGYI